MIDGSQVGEIRWLRPAKASSETTLETLALRAGDIAYFTAGTPSTWTITKPFKKFVITPPSDI